MIGPCAKATVTCIIVSPEGRQFVGTNYCNNAQSICPRAPGEGYEKCASICDQEGHAEEVAISLAGPAAIGATAYITGHTYACQKCQEKLFGGGVAFLSIGLAALGNAVVPQIPEMIGSAIMAHEAKN